MKKTYIYLLSSEWTDVWEKPIIDGDEPTKEFTEFIMSHPKREVYSLNDFINAFDEGDISDTSYIIKIEKEELV